MEKNKSVIIRRPRHEDAQALKKLFEDTIEFVFELNDIDLPDLKAEEISGKQAFLMEDLESNGEKKILSHSTCRKQNCWNHRHWSKQ